MRTFVDGHKTYLTRMTTVCKTCESYAFIRREILSTQNPSCDFAVWERVKAYASIFGAYTKLVYNDLDVFEKVPIRRVIRRKIHSCDRPITLCRHNAENTFRSDYYNDYEYNILDLPYYCNWWQKYFTYIYCTIQPYIKLKYPFYSMYDAKGKHLLISVLVFKFVLRMEL